MVIFLCIVLALVTFMMSMAILVQEPKQSGLSGSFGMGGEQMLGAGSPNAISKFTGVLAAIFLGLCLVIGLVDQKAQDTTSIELQEGDTTGGDPGFEAIDGGTGESVTPTPTPGGAGESGGTSGADGGGSSLTPAPADAPDDGSGG